MLSNPRMLCRFLPMSRAPWGSWRAMGVMVTAMVALGAACSPGKRGTSAPRPDGGAGPGDGGMSARARGTRAGDCLRPRTSEPIPLRAAVSIGPAPLSFDDLRKRIYGACGKCHLAPANQGNFSYRDTY